MGMGGDERVGLMVTDRWRPGFQDGLGALREQDPHSQPYPSLPGLPALLRLSRNRGHQHQAGSTRWHGWGAPPGHCHQDGQPDLGGCRTPFLPTLPEGGDRSRC